MCACVFVLVLETNRIKFRISNSIICLTGPVIPLPGIVSIYEQLSAILLCSFCLVSIVFALFVSPLEQRKTLECPSTMVRGMVCPVILTILLGKFTLYLLVAYDKNIYTHVCVCVLRKLACVIIA